MSHLMYINASPRGAAAASGQAADLFLEALPGGTDVERLDLFDAGLPQVTEDLVNAKFKFASGADLNAAEKTEWRVVEELVARFLAADHYLLAVPMWNFSIPYILKQYIDLITHPGLTFARDENGMKGLASGSATVIYSRGGDYTPKDGKPDPYDFQSPYLKAWLGLVGISPVNEVLVQKTMAGVNAQAEAVEEAAKQLRTLAAGIG